MRDPVLNLMISKIQRHVGPGTRQVRGSKWVQCPCCLGSGGNASGRRLEYRAAKKTQRHAVRCEIATELADMDDQDPKEAT